MPYKILFEAWVSEAGQPAGPVFSVHNENNVRVNRQHFLLSPFHLDELFHIAESKVPLIDRTKKVRQVVIRYGIWCLEGRLRDGLFPLEPSAEPLILYVNSEDMPILMEYLRKKSCGYRVQSGRNVYCSAAMDSDKRSISQIERKYVAITSPTTCFSCDLPDTGLLCSHFQNPGVITPTHGVPSSNRVASALCAIGRTEVEHPAQCHAGGNVCWERVVGPETSRYQW